MAEKIIDIKLNAKEAQKELEKFAKTSEEIEENVDNLNLELGVLEKKLLDTRKGTKEYDRLNKLIQKTKNSIKSENRELKLNNREKRKLDKKTKQLNTKLKQQAKNHNEVSRGITKSIGGTGALDRATGGLFSTIQGLTGGLAGATRGFGFLKTALISSGVGAFVVVVGSLVAAFTSTEEGQNRLQKGLNQLKAVFANITSVATTFGNGLLNIGKSIKNIFTGEGSLDDVTKSIGKTFTTVKEQVKTLGEDIKEDVKAAADLSDMVAKADKIDRELLIRRQKDNTRINDLRTKAYDTERFNEQERIAFLEEAIKIEDAITNREIEAAKLRANAKIAENNLVDEVRKEDLDEQAKLEAKVFELEAKKLNRQREVANQRQMILRKEKSAQDKIEQEAIDKEKERQESLQDILDEIKQQKEEEEAVTEIEQLDLEEQRKLKELEDLQATEEQKFTIQEFFANKRKQLEKNQAEEQLKLEKELSKQRVAMAKNTLMNIANAFGRNSEAGKAAAIAASLINTYQGITAELATKTVTPFDFALKVANIAATTAIGFQSVKSIASTNPKSASTSTSINTPAGRGAVASTPPDFNVGGTTQINQLAESIGQQQDKPVKAFVVSTEISTQQELDRNTEDNAQIG